eukprot:4274745-Amphidinium_carterae.1
MRDKVQKTLILLVFLGVRGFTTSPGHWIIAVFTGLCILAQALNPNLPVSLAIAQSVSAHRMASSVGVKCLAPPKVPIAGKVHVMVMDKTGTITKD